jgi:hypothetical protein
MTPPKEWLKMAEKYLFINSAVNKRIYNLNQGYWKRLFKASLGKEITGENVLFRNFDARGDKIYDANPIFSYIDSEKNKAIRIIQDDNNLIEHGNMEMERFLISAWLDNVSIYRESDAEHSEKIVDELVIALFLTRKTAQKAMELVVKWLYETLSDEDIVRIINE